MNVLDGWLYYEGVCDDISGLYKQRLDGTENQLLFEDFVTHVHVIGEWVYFDTNSERGKVIYRIKTDGTDYQVFAHLEESN